MKFKVGQKWRERGGKSVITITKVETDSNIPYPVWGRDHLGDHSYTRLGRAFLSLEHAVDLVELVEDVPAEATTPPPPIPAAPKLKVEVGRYYRGKDGLKYKAVHEYPSDGRILVAYAPLLSIDVQDCCRYGLILVTCEGSYMGEPFLISEWREPLVKWVLVYEDGTACSVCDSEEQAERYAHVPGLRIVKMKEVENHDEI